MPDDEQGELVTVTVAAQRTGRTPDTIRSSIRRGRLSASKGNDGQWRVWLPAESLQKSETSDSHQQELDRLRTELAAAVHRAADSAATVADLRERLARVEGEAAAAARVEQELKAALAWHRQPWWRRLIGV